MAEAATEKASRQPDVPFAADVEKRSGDDKAGAGAAAGQGGPTFPDGGLKAWMTVAGAWLVMFSTFGYINAFGVYEAYYIQYYLPNESPSKVALIGSFQLFLMFLGGGICGRLFDEGYFKAIIIPGSLLYVFSLMMTSLAQQYYSIFLAQGVGMGLGIGCLFLPTLGCISHHFQRRRALATGIVVTGSSIGGICFPIMLNNLFDNPNVGFGWGVRASAFLILGCLTAACFLMTTRLPPRKQRPVHMQKKPDMKSILTDKGYLITMTGLFFVTMGLFYPFFYVQVFAEVHGLAQNISFYSLAILNAASVFGRTIPNFLADKYGSHNLMLPCVFMSGILCWILLACTSPGGIIVFAILYGFFSGAYVSLIATVIASWARDVTEIGVRLGVAFTLASFSALAGTPINGVLVGDDPHNYTFWKGSTFSGVVILTGTALIFTGRMIQAKRKGTQFV